MPWRRSTGVLGRGRVAARSSRTDGGRGCGPGGPRVRWRCCYSGCSRRVPQATPWAGRWQAPRAIGGMCSARGQSQRRALVRPERRPLRVDLLLIRGDVEHVRPVLPGAHAPVDPGRRRIIAANGLGALGREPHFSANECQSVYANQRCGINSGQRFARDEVYDIELMEAAVTGVGNVGRLSIRRRDHLMRIRSHGNPLNDLQARWVHDREGVVGLRAPCAPLQVSPGQ